MTTLEVGKKLVELCDQGKYDTAMDLLYSPDIVSIEASVPPGQSAETRGLQGVLAKAKWWSDNHIVHAAKHDGPYPNGDQFIVKMTLEITRKAENRRFTMEEMALYTVANGKIVHEVFFYQQG